MKNILWKVIITICLFSLLNQNYAVAERLALLVGVSQPERNVRFPANDVRLMKIELNRAGFDDIRVIQKNEATQINVLNKMERLALGAEEDDLILFYFTGLGEQNYGQTLYHVAGDATFSQSDLNDNFLKNTNRRAKAVAIMDACYGGHRGDINPLFISISKQQQIPSILIGAENLAYESDELTAEEMEGFGIFTYSLYQAIEEWRSRGSQRPVSLEKVIDSAKSKYEENTEGYAPRVGSIRVTKEARSIMADIPFIFFDDNDKGVYLRNEHSIIVKAIAKSPDVKASLISSLSQSINLKFLKHYFVLSDTDLDLDEEIHIRDYWGNKKDLSVRKDNVKFWHTREGIWPKPDIGELPEEDRVAIKAWDSFDKIKRRYDTGDPTYGPDYIEIVRHTSKVPHFSEPFPLLEAKVLNPEKSQSLIRRALKVLIPVVNISGSEVEGDVDIAIVIDCSRSMRPYIDGTRTVLKYFLNRLRLASSSVRIAIIGYRDTPNMKSPIEFNEFETVESAVKTLINLDAGDIENYSIEEAMYDGCFVAINHPGWRHNSRRFMIVVPNTSSHASTKGIHKLSPKGRTINDLISEAEDKRVKIFGVQAGQPYSQEYDPYPQIRYLADKRDGYAFRAERESKTEYRGKMDRIIDRVFSEFISNLATVLFYVVTKGTDIPRGTVIFREGWIVEDPNLFEQKILLSQGELESLIETFDRFATFGTTNAAQFLEVLNGILIPITGQPITLKETVEHYFKDKLGITFQTDLLNLSIVDIVSMDRTKLQKWRKECKYATDLLGEFEQLAEAEFNKHGMAWMPIKYLP